MVKMECDKDVPILERLQEMQFTAIELNLYLDTHPCDADAIHDFNCAVEMIQKLKCEYEEEYGPLLNFGQGGFSREPWQWSMGPWPWEV